jgi:hypothetical protein
MCSILTHAIAVDIQTIHIFLSQVCKFLLALLVY